ncbi:MFS transporter [Specibacter cremeus]|uniref:MFS transporter n=1 Tax=Specibacter cremeus TaxID=1629051 RepID=UPI001F0CA384|nr:MFS transporter [Specibacter cremeus]
MAWGGNHFTPLLSLYRDIGHYSVLSVDLFLATYVGGLVPGLLVAGPLSDRYGRKPLAAVGVGLGIAASVVLALFFRSEALMCAGRVLAGLGVGIGMAVGTSWLKELSTPPFDTTADDTAGARRPSLSLTLGFGLGAGVSGALAQWGPWPTTTPYAVHIALSLAALAALAGAPETVRKRATTTSTRRGSLLADLRVPLAGHRRFRQVVLPAAPWVFATAGVAYAVIPMLETPRLGGMQLGYATLLTVVTLGTGALVQPFTARINRLTGGRAMLVGMAAMIAGLVIAAVNAHYLSPWAGAAAAVLLGASYGIALVSGLVEIQHIATGADLAGLTGVYYSLSYAGFVLPMALAGLAVIASYTVLLAVVALICLGCLVLVAVGLRRTAVV